MASHAVSDSTLQKYWRQAVLKRNHNTCIVCGIIKSSGYLECHHIIRRGHRVTRHDSMNGIPVCVGECHRKAHTERGKADIRTKLGETHMDYLYEKEAIFIKDYRAALEHSPAEHERFELANLKAELAMYRED